MSLVLDKINTGTVPVEFSSSLYLLKNSVSLLDQISSILEEGTKLSIFSYSDRKKVETIVIEAFRNREYLLYSGNESTAIDYQLALSKRGIPTRIHSMS